MPYLPTIMIQLLIQRPLIRMGQMAIIFLPHIMLLLVDGPKIAAILAGLRPGKLTIPAFGINTMFLAILPSIDLIDTGMVLKMGRLVAWTLSKGRGRNK